MDAPGAETAKLSPKMTPREFGVIDGQQRLVTLMTLLAVLRDLETDDKKPVGKRVQNMLIAQLGTRFFRTERFRLHLSTRERAVFEDNVLLPGSSGLPANILSPSVAEATLLDVRDRFRTVLSEMTNTRARERSRSSSPSVVMSSSSSAMISTDRTRCSSFSTSAAKSFSATTS